MSVSPQRALRYTIDNFGRTLADDVLEVNEARVRVILISFSEISVVARTKRVAVSEHSRVNHTTVLWIVSALHYTSFLVCPADLWIRMHVKVRHFQPTFLRFGLYPRVLVSILIASAVPYSFS